MLVPGFAHVVPDWRAASHWTTSLLVVEHHDGHLVYLVVETIQVHIFYPVASVEVDESLYIPPRES